MKNQFYRQEWEIIKLLKSQKAMENHFNAEKNYINPCEFNVLELELEYFYNTIP